MVKVIPKNFKHFFLRCTSSSRGGGGLSKVHMVERGVCQKSTSVYKGEGGVKNGPKVM